MTAALPLVFAVPFLSAVITILVPRPGFRRAVALGVPAAVLVAGVVLVGATSDGSVVATQVAGWIPGIAIPFAADMLSALMLSVSGLLVLAGTVFALAAGDDDDPWFVPLLLLMTAGVYGAYLTADLFNLFVMIEVALLPSYVLLARTGTGAALRAARLYLVVNLTASTILLGGVGFVYGTTGTVALAELAGMATALAPVSVATGVVVVALAVKAALVPVHTWLPATYPAASPAVTAIFSGLLTKIGVYGLIRVMTLLVVPTATIRIAVIAVMVASMIVGVLGAFGDTTMRGVLAYHMISQVGYILVGLVLAGSAGLAAVVFYLVHHTVVKTSLFLSLGAVEVRRGTGRIKDLGGVAAESRWLALAFFLGALSLVGLPPMSGFWAKLGVLRAAVVDEQIVVVVIALVVSVGTLVSMLKVGNGVFWGTRPDETSASPAAGSTSAGSTSAGSAAAGSAAAGSAAAGSAASGRTATGHLGAEPLATGQVAHPRPTSRVHPAALVGPGLVLGLASLAVGLAPNWLLDLSSVAGESLADPSAYTQALLER